MLDRKKASWQDILQRLSESDLRNFVFQLAEDNRDLQKKIVLDFSRGKSSVQEMHRYEREIDRVLAPYDLWDILNIMPVRLSLTRSLII